MDQSGAVIGRDDGFHVCLLAQRGSESEGIGAEVSVWAEEDDTVLECLPQVAHGVVVFRLSATRENLWL